MAKTKTKIRPVEITEPEGGWKPSTYYLAMVSLCPGNPEHEVIFYSGFLNGVNPRDPKILMDGNRRRDAAFISDRLPYPGGYNVIWNPTYDGSKYEIHQVETFRIVKKLHTEGEL